MNRINQVGQWEKEVRAKPETKKRMDKLDTVFSCPFAIMDPVLNAASISYAESAKESFSMTINGMISSCYETFEYSRWIDECERSTMLKMIRREENYISVT
ncbi:hypothetical protein MKW92_000890 [Papaver armeniacum]|nr:hypothetical protein MKW92_000890 [Papaver armeniacum]